MHGIMQTLLALFAGVGLAPGQAHNRSSDQDELIWPGPMTYDEDCVFPTEVPPVDLATPPAGYSVYISAYDTDCTLTWDMYNPQGATHDRYCNSTYCIDNYPCTRLTKRSLSNSVLLHGWQAPESWKAEFEIRGGELLKNRSLAAVEDRFSLFGVRTIEIEAPDDGLWDLTVSMAAHAHIRIRHDRQSYTPSTGSTVGHRGRAVFSGSIDVSSDGVLALRSGDPDFPTIDTGFREPDCYQQPFECQDEYIDQEARTVTYRGRGSASIELAGPTIEYFSGCPTHDCVNFPAEGGPWSGDGPIIAILMGYSDPTLPYDGVDFCGDVYSGGNGKYPSEFGGVNDHFARLNIEFRPVEGYDCDGDLEPDVVDGGSDWNSNGIPDLCDILSGVLSDCDGDLVPDEQVIADDPSLDCNLNGLLDFACEVLTDEDADGTADECQIAAQPDLDCNENGRLDAVEIAEFSELDCNQNGLPDSCELADLPALDADGDGILDDCVPRWTPIAMSVVLDEWVRTQIGEPVQWYVDSIGANGWVLVRVRVYLGGSSYQFAFLRYNLDTGEVGRLYGVPSPSFAMINGFGEVAVVRVASDPDGTRRRVFYWPAGQTDYVTTLDVVEASSGSDASRSFHESGWLIADWAAGHARQAPRLINARTGEIRLLHHFEDYDVVGGTGGMSLHRIMKDGRIIGRRWRTGGGSPSCIHAWAGPFEPIESAYCSAWQCNGYSEVSSSTGISALWSGQAYAPCGGWREIGNRIYDAFGNEYGSRAINNRGSLTSRADYAIDQVLDGGQIIASPSTSDGEQVVVVWPTLSSERYFDARDLLTGDPQGISDLGSEDIDITGHDYNPMISYEGSFVLRQSEQIGVVHKISYPAPPGLDLTADGLADDADLLALVRFLAGQGPEPAGDADLNRDGSIDEADAQALAWWLIASRAGTLPDCDGDGTPDLAELARFGGTLPDADNDLVPDGCVPSGCNLADLAPPLGLHDLADVVAFVDGFAAGDTALDFDGSGLLDLADIVAFVTAFGAGCP